MSFNLTFRSPNYSPRTKKIKYVVLHYTQMDFDEALKKLTDRKSNVSAHYFIKKNGEIFNLVDEEKVAWHAGKSSWFGEEAINNSSVGIELDNSGFEEFSSALIDACLFLCKTLKIKYTIPDCNFIGHSDIAPNRKIDPGIYFQWKNFARHGFGIWFDDTVTILPQEKILHKFGDKNSQIKYLQESLKKLGYDIKITGEFDLQTNFVVRSFQSKFYPRLFKTQGQKLCNDNNTKYRWGENSRNILNSLLKLY